MKTLWILTGNRGFVKIYEVKGHGKQIKEIHHIDNPEGLKKNSEIFSDRPGRAFDRMGGGRHALSSETEYHEHEQQLFAHRLAALLQENHESKAYDELALVGPSHFLGDLNLAIHDGIKKIIIKEVGKDLPIHLSEQERIGHLCEYLDLWNHSSQNT
jgi:protein required for attachment to host cells